MTEPTQLFLTLSCTTQDGVIHRKYETLDVDVLEGSKNPEHLLYAEYMNLKSRFRAEVYYEKTASVS